MGKRIQLTGWVLAVAFLFLLWGCGSSGGASSGEGDGDGGDNAFPGQTVTGEGSGNGYSEPFHSEGCEVQISMTHSDESRFLLFIIDKTDGSAFKTIVYTTAISGEIQEFDLPEGDYWIEVETTGGWSVGITGCVYTYLDPDDYETDIGLYTGCNASCCEDNGGVFGCYCPDNRCICNDDSFSENCECQCVGGAVSQ